MPAYRLLHRLPDMNKSALSQARELGFSYHRSLTRMYLNTNLIPSDPFGQWATAGPATG
jgi:hypothetical protein